MRKTFSSAAFLRSFLLLILAFVTGAALAAPGDLITRTLQKFPGGVDYARRVVVQSDGKPIVIGDAVFGTQQFAMTRFNTNGTIDTTYGANRDGTQLEPIGSGNSEAWGAAFDSSGRLVVAGHVRSGKDRFGIARFNADGALDLTFGGGGSAIDVGPGDAGGYSMAIQPDGKIVVGGYSIGSNGRKVFTVVRYTDTDTLDTTFGTGGAYVAAPFGAVDSIVNAIVVQSTGKIVIAGSNGTDLALQRLNANGTLDTTFGTSGTATFTAIPGAGATAMTAYADDRLLVLGNKFSTSQILVIRTTADGALDTTFGTSGVASVSDGNGGTSGSIVLNGDGSIVVSGTFTTGGGNRFMIAKFTAAGALDTTFGTNGSSVVSAFGGQSDIGVGLAARPGGGYFVVGSGFLPTSSVSDTEVAAFNASGQLDTTFNGVNPGFAVVDLGVPAASANASVIQPDGKVVVAGVVGGNTSGTCDPTQSASKAVVARYLADGTLDTSFNSPAGYITIGTMRRAGAVTLDGSGNIVVGGCGITLVGSTNTASMAFARITPSGTLDTSFNGTGVFTIPVATSHEEITSIVMQGSRIVGAGFVTPGTFTDSVFVGVTSAGALDGTFGSGGKTVVAVSTGDDEVNGLALQSDGKIVGAGFTTLSGTQDGMTAVRLNTNGTLDTAGFGSPNGFVSIAFGANSARGYAVAIDTATQKILVGGKATISLDNFAVARLNTNGSLDSSFGSGGLVTSNFHNNHNRIFALALSGTKIIGAGEDAGSFGLVQYQSTGQLDTTFGTGGESSLPINFMAGADYALSLNVATNGNLYAAGNGSSAFALAIIQGSGASLATPTVSLASSVNPATTGQSVTFTATVTGAAGTPTGSVSFLDGGSAISGCASVALSSGSAICTTSALTNGTHSITASYAGNSSYTSGTSNTVTQAVQAPSTTLSLAASPASIDFGGESMGTTSAPQTITVTNNGTGTVTITGIAASSQFAQTNNCSSVAAGATCTITVTFTPSPQAGAIGSADPVSGSVTITSNASNSPATVTLAGSAEKSLVTHFYEAILRRAPDAGGKSFWQSEALRMQSDGANPNEAWYAMSVFFFNGSEYASLNRDNAGFVTDMYVTFFNRAPDGGGLDFWVSQLNAGMPREVVLASFLFSPEFTSFTQGIFGNTAARAEIDVVMDFYRGGLARLPDDGGLAFWVQQFRTAQCQGAGPVYTMANSISSQFFNGQEYAGRNRTNAQFVGDLYNAFLRRGGDQGGVQFWINQLNTGAMTRDQVRFNFLNSPEFGNRVNAVVQQGCLQ